MSVIADLKTVWQLATGRDRGTCHAERLENFYRKQASHYDHFRKNFLTGRRELMAACPWKKINRWVDLGAGTGGLLEFVPQNVLARTHVDLVDLSPSLLSQAQERITRMSLTNAAITRAE